MTARMRWWGLGLLILCAANGPAWGQALSLADLTAPEQHGLYAEVDFLFVRPNMKESFQATATVPPAGPMSLIPIQGDFNLSPRFELGMALTDDLGVRASYWYYDHNMEAFNGTSSLAAIYGATAVTTVYPANIAAPPGATLHVQSAIRAQSLDLEGVIPLQIGRTLITASGGLEYASLQQSYDAGVLGTPIALNFDRNMHGVGPTLAMEARHPLGDTGFAFVGAGRGALLVAEKNLHRTVVGDVTPTPGPAVITLANAGEPTGVFEFSLGVEWNRELGEWGDLLLGASYESQLWTGGGAPTMTYLGFDGFAASVGLRF